MPRKPSGNTQKITLLIAPDLYSELGRAAAEENTNGSELLRRVVRQYVTKYKRQAKQPTSGGEQP